METRGAREAREHAFVAAEGKRDGRVARRKTTEVIRDAVLAALRAGTSPPAVLLAFQEWKGGRHRRPIESGKSRPLGINASPADNADTCRSTGRETYRRRLPLRPASPRHALGESRQKVAKSVSNPAKPAWLSHYSKNAASLGCARPARWRWNFLSWQSMA